MAMAAARAVGDPRGGGLHRVLRKVSEASGRQDLAVAEELADQRKALIERESSGREGVSFLPNSESEACVRFLAARRRLQGPDEPGPLGVVQFDRSEELAAIMCLVVRELG